MLCLGIESSCDDTSLALVRDGKLVGQSSASQADLHALFGGVVPEMASREHARFIGPLFDCLLSKAECHPSDIDVVAVARGPGLLGSLLVGVAFAKALALGTGARFVGVNHLHAHIFAAGLEQELSFPSLALLVSGGHTHLYRVESPCSLIPLGRTLDDAAGEAFDKAGKLLGLPYPAGRHIDELANEGNPDPKLFPRPYLDNDSLDFSFSGLKTAMAVFLSSRPELSVSWDADTGAPFFPRGEARAALANVCASYRQAVVDTLAAKTEKALDRKNMRDAKGLILAGGVAANSLLRESMRERALRRGLPFFVPSPALCTDNGAMIAYLGWILAERELGHDLDMEAVARGGRVPDDLRRQTPHAL